jgi:hypothetical protein
MKAVYYWVGHALSIPMVRLDWAWLYPAYNWLMGKALT